MLLLFDVDATLLTTSKAGMFAMEDAGRELFGPSFTIARTEFAGRLDPLIIRDLLTHNAQPASAPNTSAMRDGYRKHIARRLAEPGVARSLPGVSDLIAALATRSSVTLGLLTGNYEDTGTLKLRASGLEPSMFPIRVWGEDSPHDPPSREHLPPVGIARFQKLTGRSIPHHHVTIIGDTPHDIACAKANSCRSLGVATGPYDVSRLREAGADHAVPNLADTTAILKWLVP